MHKHGAIGLPKSICLHEVHYFANTESDGQAIHVRGVVFLRPHQAPIILETQIDNHEKDSTRVDQRL